MGPKSPRDFWSSYVTAFWHICSLKKNSRVQLYHMSIFLTFTRIHEHQFLAKESMNSKNENIKINTHNLDLFLLNMMTGKNLGN